MRIAWFSPLPPVKTGVAGRSAELVAALRSRGHIIDVFVGAPPRRAPGAARSAHDFVWLDRLTPYDLPVYQFGNSSHHDYIWAYALHYPGLVVLHDTRLHHARAAFLLRERRAADYRAEFAWSEPSVSPDAAELAIAGFSSALLYQWPMVRALVETARLTAVHGEGARRELIAALDRAAPTAGFLDGDTDHGPIVAIRLGEGAELSESDARAARSRLRAQYGIPAEAILFACVGGVTPEKRVTQILAALKAVQPLVPAAHLLLVGGTFPHYDVGPEIAAHGLEGRVTITGYVADDRSIAEHLAAADVSLNLRWPSARETSGPWLRALAMGVPTVATDLVHQTDFATLDPRTWLASPAVDPADAGTGRDLGAPVCVAVDILDEDHSLRLAMRRLGTDPELRANLGRAGHDYWQRNHTIDAMAEDYERAMERARARTAPRNPSLPSHLTGGADGTLRAISRLFHQEQTLARDGLL